MTVLFMKHSMTHRFENTNIYFKVETQAGFPWIFHEDIFSTL